jgi:cytochrome c peroxidase
MTLNKHLYCFILSTIGLSLGGCFPIPVESPSSDLPASQAASARPITSTADADLIAEAKIHFQPLMTPPDSSTPQVKLGKMLFFEARLSLNNTLSCKSCHNLESFGVDQRATSLGHIGQTGTRNAPTVLNASLNSSQFWDGRAKSLKDQAGQPILNPLEMAMPNEAAVLAKLEKIPGYVKAFQAAFPDQEKPLTYSNLSQALASFEETLLTPSRFDSFLKGDSQSLTESEKTGLKTFMNRGCVACHFGPGLGGQRFHKFGVMEPYKHQQDLGLYEVTKKNRDKYLFKVPLLRNITQTAPYFHDGKIRDLKEAVQIMIKTELGTEFSNAEIENLLAFLKSLTGEVPTEARSAPVLPN